MLYFYYAQGQLGNQFLQYAFLLNIKKKNDLLIVSGFDDLLKLCDIDDKLINFSKKKIVRAYMYICSSVLKFFARIKLIKSIRVKKDHYNNGYIKEGIDIIESNGLINKFVYVYSGSYNSNVLHDNFFTEKVTIKEEFVNKAKQVLQKIKGNKFFVHIRLGDYDNFTVMGKSVKLPLSYYNKAIIQLLQIDKNATFIFLSNKPAVVEKKFKHIDKKYISNNSAEVDFTILSLCDGGVMSASSFSYWGAMYNDNKKKHSIYAPKYWYGFNHGFEYPPKSFPLFAESIKIDTQR